MIRFLLLDDGVWMFVTGTMYCKHHVSAVVGIVNGRTIRAPSKDSMQTTKVSKDY